MEYKLKDGRTYVAHYDRNSVCKVRKATLELLFAELDKSYEQAKILEKIKENYALFRASSIQIPDNATNGDMIIEVFPELKYTIQNGRVVTTIGIASSFDLDWWNAPYKGGETE